MNTKHTPGPWFVPSADAEGAVILRVCAHGATICDVSLQGGWVGGRDEKPQANAALIAAAPCIATALEALLIAVNDSLVKAEPKVIAAMQEARAAIEETAE